MAQKPQVSFTCNAVAQILGLFNAGLNVHSLDMSAAVVDLGYRQGKNLSDRYGTGDASNEKLRLTQAMMVWDTIRAVHQQNAEIVCRILPAYNGTANPIINVGTGTLTGTPAATQFFTLGPTYVNGVRLENEIDFTLASGVALLQSGSAGEVWDRYIGVNNTDDILTLTTHGKPWSAYGITGGAISANVVQYMRAKDPDGANEADGTAAHVKITATNGIIVPDGTTGAGNTPSQNTLTISLRAADGSSNALAFAVNQAIT
jgi:hypothetical protein